VSRILGKLRRSEDRCGRSEEHEDLHLVTSSLSCVTFVFRERKEGEKDEKKEIPYRSPEQDPKQNP